MKNLFFALALMLVGTFAFANNSVDTKINVKETIKVSKKNVANQIDYTSFKEMLLNDSIEKGQFVFSPYKIIVRRYLDGCGNWWIVIYDNSEISDFDAYILAGEAINDYNGC